VVEILFGGDKNIDNNATYKKSEIAQSYIFESPQSIKGRGHRTAYMVFCFLA
jgi:hypothetical protein